MSHQQAEVHLWVVLLVDMCAEEAMVVPRVILWVHMWPHLAGALLLVIHLVHMLHQLQVEERWELLLVHT
jgi:hypothetical protein